MCLGVDCDREHGMSRPARFPDGASAVLDPIAAIVVVEVVGFAVGQHEQQTLARWPLGERS